MSCAYSVFITIHIRRSLPCAHHPHCETVMLQDNLPLILHVYSGLSCLQRFAVVRTCQDNRGVSTPIVELVRFERTSCNPPLRTQQGWLSKQWHSPDVCRSLNQFSPVNSTTFINLLHKLERLYAIVFSGVQCPPEGRAPARSRCTEFTQSPITGTASSGYEHVCGLCGNRTRTFSVQERHTPVMLRALFNIYYTTQFLFCQGSICISFLGYLFINHLVGVIHKNALLY